MSDMKHDDGGEEWPPAPTLRPPAVPKSDLGPGWLAISLLGPGWVLAINRITSGWLSGSLGLFLCVFLPITGFLVSLSGGRTWTAIVARYESFVLIICYVILKLVPK